LLAIRIISRLPFAPSVRKEDFVSRPWKKNLAASASDTGSSSPMSIGVALIDYPSAYSADRIATVNRCVAVRETDEARVHSREILGIGHRMLLPVKFL
jgi:hypothetical protein